MQQVSQQRAVIFHGFCSLSAIFFTLGERDGCLLHILGIKQEITESSVLVAFFLLCSSSASPVMTQVYTP